MIDPQLHHKVVLVTGANHGIGAAIARALGGGVTRSLALDAHGKSRSSLLLELEIEVPERS